MSGGRVGDEWKGWCVKQLTEVLRRIYCVSCTILPRWQFEWLNEEGRYQYLPKPYVGIGFLECMLSSKFLSFRKEKEQHSCYHQYQAERWKHYYSSQVMTLANRRTGSCTGIVHLIKIWSVFETSMMVWYQLALVQQRYLNDVSIWILHLMDSKEQSGRRTLIAASVFFLQLFIFEHQILPGMDCIYIPYIHLVMQRMLRIIYRHKL